MKRVLIFILFATMSGCMGVSRVLAQGMSRSTGLGMRVSFWNIASPSSQMRFAVSGADADVSISGAGGYIYVFTRMYNSWFFEFNLGGLANVNVQTQGGEDKVKVSSLAPILLGVRYDLFATRLSGSVLPYLSAGGGPYWYTRNEITTTVTGEQVEGSMRSDFGWYLGGGTNILLSSWFGLNFDLKYHFVEFDELSKFDSGLEFGMGFSFMWGSRRELFRVRGVRPVVEEIYPAYYRFYSTYPLALVTIENLVGHPIEVNVRSNVKGYSEKPKDSGYIRIDGGETKDIQVTALLGPRTFSSEERKVAFLDLTIEGRTGTVTRKQFSTQIVIHSRNAWDGEMDKLAFFLTPEDERIMQLSRETVGGGPSTNEPEAGQIEMARKLFDRLGDMGITYHPDPKIPFYQDDRVQFAAETLEIGAGDCDDLVVMYSSLLQSVGIKTAFVEVRDPQKEIAHLYLMFDTGLPADQGESVSSNEKRYILRQNKTGQQSIWIPVETTLVEEGFEAAWKAAALSYLEEGLLRNGLAEGWLFVIDTE